MLVSNAVLSESILVTSGNISFIAASDSLKVQIATMVELIVIDGVVPLFFFFFGLP